MVPKPIPPHATNDNVASSANTPNLPATYLTRLINDHQADPEHLVTFTLAVAPPLPRPLRSRLLKTIAKFYTPPLSAPSLVFRFFGATFLSNVTCTFKSIFSVFSSLLQTRYLLICWSTRWKKEIFSTEFW